MPIKEYECNKCKNCKENLIITKDDEIKLPRYCECGGEYVSTPSLSTFRLKGSGWVGKIKKS